LGSEASTHCCLQSRRATSLRWAAFFIDTYIPTDYCVVPQRIAASFLDCKPQPYASIATVVSAPGSLGTNRPAVVRARHGAVPCCEHPVEPPERMPATQSRRSAERPGARRTILAVYRRHALAFPMGSKHPRAPTAAYRLAPPAGAFQRASPLCLQTPVRRRRQSSGRSTSVSPHATPSWALWHPRANGLQPAAGSLDHAQSFSFSSASQVRSRAHGLPPACRPK
jgi:hypothetical protein